MIVDEFDVIDYEAGVSNDILGAECSGCRRLLTFRGNFFPKDSSKKSGYGPLCHSCLKSPVLSVAEHAARLQEMNFNSEGTRRQRHALQSDFKEATRRGGHSMDCSLFLQKLLHVYPQLYVTQGGVTVNGAVVDLALYATSGTNRPEWDNQSFKYLGYVTLGVLPEYSEYEYDNRDILLRCKQIGWRSVLLRFVENNILTEAQCLAEFGPPSGGENSLWYKKLYNHRNAKKIA